MTKKAEKSEIEILAAAMSHPNVKSLVFETDGRWRVKLVEGEPYAGKDHASLIEFCKKSLKL
jgi:hypothetical protein